MTSPANAAARSPRAARAIAVGLTSCLALLVPETGAAYEVGSAVYVRTDSDDTLIITPHMRVRAGIADATHLQVAYTVDVWTSASVDIVSSASQPVTEQRDEITVDVDHEFTDVTVDGGYRYSSEPDYDSHGVFGSLSYEFAKNNATLGLNLGATFDTVGRAGDPGFARSVRFVNAGVSLTQVLDQDTLVQGIYNLAHVGGYQSSPYRFVGVGGDGLCMGSAPLCVPESNPTQRLRHAIALRGRRALGENFSLGGSYRLYFDDWGLGSQTVRADISWLPADRTMLTLRYRGYVQSSADHYQPFYLGQDGLPALVTNDKELSPFSSHRLGLDLERGWELQQDAMILRTVVAVAPSVFLYSDYPLVDRITALEVTGAAVLEF